MHRRVVVVSVDGLSTIDLPHLESLPGFRELLERGTLCREMRGIYPTQTYPLHASAITGCYPHRHGIHANTLFQPGRVSPDWHWYRRFLRAVGLDEVARGRGFETASLLWPGAARSRNRFVIPEIKATRPGQSFPWLLFTGGSPLFMLRMGYRYRALLKNLEFFHLDNFTTAVASHLIRKRKTHLLLLHLLDLDGTRHRRGFRAPETQMVLEDQDRRLGTLLAAAKDSGGFEDTTFIVFGDHAYIDVHTRVRINAAFGKAGLLERDPRGNLLRWEAWANCCEGSAQVGLRESADRSIKKRVAEVFAGLQGKGAVDTVFSGGQIRELKLNGPIDYVLEAAPGYYFAPDIEGQVLTPAPERFRAAHGYRPDLAGYSSLFIAAGSGIREGVELENLRIVDLGPSVGALLGLRLPAAEGRVVREMLDF
jgi:predicted AlkP superfamily pyrophosphatase or phosphodiesterase